MPHAMTGVNIRRLNSISLLISRSTHAIVHLYPVHLEVHHCLGGCVFFMELKHVNTRSRVKCALWGRVANNNTVYRFMKW
jgi:hypothetical protein